MAERDRTITIQLLGTDSEELRLDDFLDELGKIRIALRETERTVCGRKPSLHFRIARLQKSSPALVVLEAVAEDESDPVSVKTASYVMRSFTTNLRVLSKRHTVPHTMDVAALEAYREITEPVTKHALVVEINPGKHGVLIDRHFSQVLDAVIGKDETSYGSISGKMEGIHLHSKNRFQLYPIVGAKRVVGRFRRKARQRFIAGVGEYVTVFGRLRYKTWDRYPYAIWADDIQVHHVGDVPTLKELKGVSPEATGSISAQEYIDRLRDEY